jgi:tetratricopeptide (TPR) repeat protein
MYDRDRCEEAIALWEKSVKLNRAFSIPWRNLGIAYYNVLHDAAAARGAYQRALQAAPDDARLLYERDQLSKRTRELPRQRLEALEQRLDLVEKRDDLAIEYCTLLNLTRQHQRARDLLASRHFQPWEGGEGLVLGQWTHTHLALANAALRANDPENAVRLLRDALQPPPNLGEARHLLANQSDLHFALGTALAAAGHASGAREQFLLAAGARGDFQRMALQPFSEMTFSSALALRTLGREQESQTLLESLLTYACDLEKRPAAIDYFATSLPTMLLFEDDLQQRQTLHARFLAAQAHLGLGDQKQARVLLTSVIAEDPGDLPAADLLEFLGGDPGLSPARA